MKIEDRKALEQYQKKLENIILHGSVNGFETVEQKAQQVERFRNDYAWFVENCFKHYATAKCSWFQIRLAKAVKKNKWLRRLVRWGRGLAKSIHCDTLIPLWLWINGEDIFMVIIANNEDKATILLSDIQAEFEANPVLIHYFGEQKLQGSWEKGDFQTKDGRFIGKALGMGQSPLGLRRGGKRPNYIVADDLEDKDTSRNPKRQDEIVLWIENDVLPLMDGEVMRFMSVNNDPWARSIQNQLEQKHPNWELDLVEAYDESTYAPAWPEKYDVNYYRKWEEDIGAIAARAQFNHKKHIAGKIFTDAMIQWAKAPALNHFTIITGFWDVAYSGNNDFNAVKVWGLHDRNFWQLKAFVRQCKMAEAIEFMYSYEESLPDTVVVHWRVESQFWNDPLRDALKVVEAKHHRGLNIIVVDRPRINKYDRILTMHPYYQNGRIYYDQREQSNNDMQVGIAQLKGIEPGYKTHDDSPDADEQALNILGKHIRVSSFQPSLGKRKHSKTY